MADTLRKNDSRNIFQEIEIFLDVIEENTYDIRNKINERLENKPISDEENAFLSYIEENAEDIEKALEVVRNKARQIEKG
ncbi:MAG: hypothetical protein AABY78_01355 [Nitrospirota bacterium]|jgi:hypothetical protein